MINKKKDARLTKKRKKYAPPCSLVPVRSQHTLEVWKDHVRTANENYQSYEVICTFTSLLLVEMANIACNVPNSKLKISVADLACGI